MSLRTALLPAIDHIRSIIGPSGFDLRPTSVTILTRTWSGGLRGSGTHTDVALALPLYTKVRHVTEKEIAGSGGRYEQGDVVVGLITPKYTNPDGSTGGFTEAQLNPTITANGVEVIYRLAPQASTATGISGDYQVLDLRRDRNLHLEVVIGRQRTTP